MYACAKLCATYTHPVRLCFVVCNACGWARQLYQQNTDICAKFLLRRIANHVFFFYFRQIHSYVSYCRWYVIYKWWWYCGRCFGYISLVFCSSSSSLYISSFFFCIHICWLLLMLRLFLFLYFKSTNWIKFFRPIDVCVCNYDIMKKTSKNGTQNSVKGYPYT